MGNEFTSMLMRSPFLYGLLSLVVFLFGGLFVPGEWYQQLNKAPWNPPNIAFPVVWTVLYCMIAWTGFKASKSNDGLLLKLWFIQLAFNAMWSWIFFGQQWILLGLANLVVLSSLVGLFIFRSLKTSHHAMALLMAPYFAWLCLATSLNLYIFIYN